MATRIDSKPNNIAAKSSKDLHCILCNEDNHKAKDCKRFPSPQDKVAKLRDLSRCTKCTGKHATEKCSAKLFKCSKCSEYHMNFLCGGDINRDSSHKSKHSKVPRKTGKSGDSSRQVTAISNVSTLSLGSTLDVFLPTFTASLNGSGNLLEVRALYDPGSQATFVREELANSLNATILDTDVLLCIKGFNSGKSFKTKRVQLSISIGEKQILDQFPTQCKEDVLRTENGICFYLKKLSMDD